jgi:hypothetical protein
MYWKVKTRHVMGSGPSKVAAIAIGSSQRQERSKLNGERMAVSRWSRIKAVARFSEWKRWLKWVVVVIFVGGYANLDQTH